MASDSAAPRLTQDFEAVDVNRANRTVALTFDRAIDLATLNNRANYYVEYVKSGSTQATNVSIPSDVQVNVANTGKSVVLVFPQYIEGTPVSFADATIAGSVKEIRIAGLKSQTGQATGWVDSGALVEAPLSVSSRTLKDARTIEVAFNVAIANASNSDFTVAGTTVNSVSVSGNTVTLKTSSDVTTTTAVTTVANNGIQSYAGHKIGFTTNTPVGDVAPKVNESAITTEGKVLTQTNRTVYLPFTTNLDTTVSEAGLAANLLVKRADKPADNEALSPVEDYSVKIVDNNKLAITFKDTNPGPNDIVYNVSVKDNAQFIRTAGTTDKFAGKSSVYTTTKNTTEADSIVATGKVTKVGKVAVQAAGTEDGLTLTADTAGAAGNVTFNLNGAPGATASVVNNTITYDSTTVTNVLSLLL